MSTLGANTYPKQKVFALASVILGKASPPRSDKVRSFETFLHRRHPLQSWWYTYRYMIIMNIKWYNILEVDIFYLYHNQQRPPFIWLSNSQAATYFRGKYLILSPALPTPHPRLSLYGRLLKKTRNCFLHCDDPFLLAESEKVGSLDPGSRLFSGKIKRNTKHLEKYSLYQNLKKVRKKTQEKQKNTREV